MFCCLRHWSVSPIFSLWNRWFLSRLWPVLSLNMDTCSWRVSRWYGSFLLGWGWFCLKRFCCLAFMIVLTSEYVVDLSFWAYVVPSFFQTIYNLCAHAGGNFLYGHAIQCDIKVQGLEKWGCIGWTNFFPWSHICDITEVWLLSLQSTAWPEIGIRFRKL